MEALFNCVMDIGEQMLLCGAEVHRVEDSISRMCLAIGCKRSDVFVITGVMIVTAYPSDGEPFTQTRRIQGSGTDLERLHRLNALSRQICSERLSVEEIRNSYSSILKCRPYPFWLECVFCAMIAASFTLFFGGTWKDAAASGVIGVVVKQMIFFTDFMHMNKIFSKLICSFFACILAFGVQRLFPMCGVDQLIIGNIMLLIPGVGLTNALRDLLIGDSVAGLLRMIEAVLTALAIGAGYFLSVLILGGF